MISSTGKKYQKHEALARPALGEWGKNELAILGTTCDAIKVLANAIIQSLSSYKVAYIDAEHTSAEADAQSVSALSKGACFEYTNKISFTRLDTNTQPNNFQKRALLNDCNLILVNGNHFTANKQIVVIDEKKPLEKKLAQLTDVQAILLKDASAQVPVYLSDHLPNIQSIPVLSFDNKDSIIHQIKQLIEQQIPAINGLVLCGGKSTRMGKDKGEISYHDKSQRQYMYELLTGFCRDTFVSSNQEQSVLLDQPLPFIEDTFLHLGPLGGILSAFQQNPNVAWLTVACDLPYLNKETIDYLIQHRNPSKMATAFMDAQSKFPEPLITIWEPKVYAVLLQFLSQGYSCPRKALINSDVELLHAPNPSAFTNVNTAEEYDEVMKTLNNKHNYC